MSSLRLFLTVFFVATGASPLIRGAEPDVTFTSVTRAHYAAWTKGIADGKLTPERVNSLVNSSRVREDEAAALAAIHLHFRGQKAPAPLEEAALLNPQHSAGPEERRDQQTRPVNLERVFSRYRKHLNSVPRSLFEKDAPHRVGMSQGNLGDCFVVCAIGALVTHHPGRLKAMVHEQPDGSYIVTFPGHKPIRVPRLTDAQIVLGSTAGQQGLWLNVMEEAVAIEHRSRGGPAVAMDVISRGGSTARTIELLTDHQVRALQLHPAAAKDRAAAEQEARKSLLAVHEHKTLACATTPRNESLPPGIATGHAFGVIGYDPNTQMVTLWNPWGNRFEPKGGPGLAHGYPTREGVFDMPLKEFERVFANLLSQTSTPLPKK